MHLEHTPKEDFQGTGFAREMLRKLLGDNWSADQRKGKRVEFADQLPSQPTTNPRDFFHKIISPDVQRKMNF